MNNLLLFLTTVFTSSVTSGLISFSFTESKERWHLRRTKIEEIYIDADAWMTQVFTYYLQFTEVLDGNISYNEVIKLSNESTPSLIGENYRRLKMNVCMYERGLLSFLKNVEVCRDQLSGKENLIRLAKNESDNLKSMKASYKTTLQSFIDQEEEFLEMVANLGSAVGAQKGQASQWGDRLKGLFDAGRARSKLFLQGFKRR